MKKYLVVLTAAIVASLALAASAGAWTTVGSCELHSYYPSYDSSNQVRGEGEIDNCGGTQSVLRLQVCMEDNYGYGWSGTFDCRTTPNEYNVGGIYAYYSDPTPAPCGFWYRTWSWGYDNGVTNTYIGNADYRC